MRIPLLVVGSKSDVVDGYSDHRMREYTEYTLQKLAKKLNSGVFTISAIKKWNVDVLGEFLMHALLDKPIEDSDTLKETANLKRMFLRAESINMEAVLKLYPEAERYKFPSKRSTANTKQVEEKVVEAKSVQEMLTDLKNGKYTYVEEEEQSVFVRTGQPPSIYPAAKKNEKGEIFNKAYDKIRNLLKPSD